MLEAADKKSKLILVVDDEPVLTEMLKVILAKEGHEVMVAEEGLSALKMAAERTPDLVFMDISMPGLSGYETAEKMKSIPSLEHTPIIFLSGQVPNRDEVKAAAGEELFCLLKPFKTQQIREIIELAMRSTIEHEDAAG